MVGSFLKGATGAGAEKELLEKAGGEIVKDLKFSEETIKELETPMIPHGIYLRDATRHWDAFLKRK